MKIKNMKPCNARLAVFLLICLFTALGLMSAAFADYTANPTTKDELVPYASSTGNVSEAHVVKFANKNWYVIGYDGVGVATDSGTMTLFYTGILFNDVFDSSSNVYGTSHINSALAEYVESTDNFTAAENGAIVTRTLSGGGSTGGTSSGHVSGSDVDAKLWLLSAAEAQKLSSGLRSSSGIVYWWLRSPGYSSGKATYVASGEVKTGTGVNNSYVIQPALQLDLGSVSYDAANNTLIAQASNTHAITVDVDTTKGTVSIPARADKNASVTFTVTPQLGYAVGTVKYNGHTLTPVNGVYSFSMPDENVTVTASFVFMYNVADHIEQNGDIFTIKTVKGWEVFCDCVASNTYSGFREKTVKLGLDITGGVTVSAGVSTRAFGGTFDGNGHTLAVALNDTTGEGTAPFRYVAGGTIQNLTVTGTVNGGMYASGLVGVAWGATVNNVTVRAAVTGNTKIGGVIGFGAYDQISISNTLFKGSLQTNGYAGGLAGWCESDSNKRTSLTIQNSLFAGTYSGNGNFHPIALRDTTYSLNTTVSGAYYTVEPTLTDPGFIDDKCTQVYLSEVEGKINRCFVHRDGLTCYDPCDLYVRPFVMTSATDPAVPVITFDGAVANAGADYTYVISGVQNNQVTDQGAYQITITGQGDYCGSCTDTFYVYKDISYLNANGQTRICTAGSYTPLCNETTLGSGWWVVAHNMTVSSPIQISGNVHLILCNNATLNASEGIHVTTGSSLTVYAQSNQEGMMGALIAGNTSGNAAIGGYSNESSGEIIINGGNITASPSTGYGSAAIGGGMGGNGYITINGGKVTAWGEAYGAAIGGGDEGFGTVVINGGTVIAWGGTDAAGIGGGLGGSNGSITINGGTITATDGINGAGIGSGAYGTNVTVTINGGKITANVKGLASAGIGTGFDGSGAVIGISLSEADDYVTAASYNGVVTVAEEKHLTDGENLYDGTLTEEQASAAGGHTLIKAYAVQIPEDIAHGTVTADKTFVAANTEDRTVTLTATPDETCTLDSLNVIDAEGHAVLVENNAFTMPDCDVTVTATFSLPLNVNDTGIFDILLGEKNVNYDQLVFAYTGEAIEPEISIRYWNATLQEMVSMRQGTDFTAVWSNNTGSVSEISEAEVIITGIDRFTGIRRIPFYISPLTLEGGSLILPDQALNGWQGILYKFEYVNGAYYDDDYEEIIDEAGIEVTDASGKKLTIGKDYLIDTESLEGKTGTEDSADSSIGEEYTVDIVGTGYYFGKLTATFKITAPSENGTWGNNLAWAFHGGTLTISGTGEMNTAASFEEYPWYEVSRYVTGIVIGQGVTGIAKGAFGGNNNENPYGGVTTVALSSTVEAIGDGAFAYNTSLNTIDLSHVRSIGTSAFNQCGNLTLTVPATVTSIRSGAFDACDNVTFTVVIGETQNGTVEASSYTASKDAVITLTATPAEWYELTNLNVTDLDGNTVAVSDNTFTMPANNVIVSAAFAEVEKFVISSDGNANAVWYHFVDWSLITDVMEEAPEGLELSMQLSENAMPQEGYYFTGEYAVNHISLGRLENGMESYPITDFIMPAEPITISAVQAQQETVSLNFSENATQTISRDGMLLLWHNHDDLFDEDYEYIDLDKSGIPDFAVTGPDYVTTADYTLLLLPNADAFGKFTFSFSDITDRYNTITLINLPSFGNPDFTLPEGLTAIEESAFEGVAGMTIVDAGICSSIGKDAFRGCTGLIQIRLPKDCTIHDDAFTGLERVYVFAPKGGSTESFCNAHNNLVFVEEK